MKADNVATIHIGDEEYYKQLERELASYDRVPINMVADTSKTETESGRFKSNNPKKSTSLVGMTQRGLASILKLEFQLEHIDYNADSWYHADLDIKEFDRLQKKLERVFFRYPRPCPRVLLIAFGGCKRK